MPRKRHELSDDTALAYLHHMIGSKILLPVETLNSTLVYHDDDNIRAVPKGSLCTIANLRFITHVNTRLRGLRADTIVGGRLVHIIISTFYTTTNRTMQIAAAEFNRMFKSIA